MELFCGPRSNSKPQRLVVLRNGDDEFRDSINCDSAFQREQLLQRAATRFELAAEDLSPLDGELVKAADLADAESARERKGDGEKRERKFTSISSAELARDTYEPRPIIDAALYADAPAVVGALYKTCKSLISIDAAISIAAGLPFLGTWTVPEPTGVLYMTGEGGKSTARDYANRVAASKGITLEDATQLRWCFTVPRLESLDDLDDFQHELDDTAAEVVFLDNLMLCISGGDAGNIYRMGSILGNVTRLCAERGVTPVFIHHFKRSRVVDRFAPGDLGDLTQAGVAEVAGQWWLLTRQKDYDPELPGEHRLWFSIGGRITDSSIHVLDIEEGRKSDPGGRHWDVRVQAPDEARRDEQERREADAQARQEERAAADVQKVVRAMAALEREHPDGNGVTAIRDRSCVRGQRLDAALYAAQDEGMIVPCEFYRSNHRTPKRGYKLNPERGG